MKSWRAAFLVLALSARSPLFAQASRTGVSVPFVGCASYGQVEKLEAPKGTSRLVPIGSDEAGALAYYGSADGLGSLAPRDWHCEGVSGSDGSTLYIAPETIDLLTWQGLDGPVVQISRVSGETSGRYEVAEILVRVFPGFRAVGRETLESMDLPFPAGPYPHDTLTRRGPKIVEYSTPARRVGLGNSNSWIGKNDLPIRGAAVVLDDPRVAVPDVLLLSVRLPPASAGLISAIVGQFERDSFIQR